MNLAMGYIKRIGVSIIEHPSQLQSLPNGKMTFVYIIPLVLGDWFMRRDERVLKSLNSKVMFILYIIVCNLILLNFSGDSNFIYFQF
jgi:hypothetical protein